MMLKTLLPPSLGLLALTTMLPAQADSGLFCNGMPSEKPQDVAKIAQVSAQKAYFYYYEYPEDDGPESQFSDGSFRKSKNYLVTGDRLVVGPESFGHRCGTFINKKGQETTRWLRADQLKIVPAGPAADWQGEWFSNVSKRKLVINGKRAEYEFWGGGSDPGRMSFDFPFKAPADHQDAVLISPEPTDSPCRLTLHRLEDYLILSGGDSCGLINANPDGVMRKR